MTINEKIQQRTYQDDKYIDHAGVIIIAGDLIDTLVGWVYQKEC